jgi:hypothetical protein
MLSTKDIKTVVCRVINVNTGKSFEPCYEAYGYEKFLEFVQFHVDNNGADHITRVRGYGYENGQRVLLAEEFVGVNGQTTAFDNAGLVAQLVEA